MVELQVFWKLCKKDTSYEYIS